MKFLLLFSVFLTLYASDIKNDYSLRFAYGLASENDLGEIVSGYIGTHPRDLSVYALDGGYALGHDVFDWPLDIYLKGGLAYFNEDQYSDAYEMTFYAKAYFNLDFFSNRIRLGAAEGLSYTTSLLECEDLEATEDKEPSSQFLNYLDLSVDFDLGRLIHYKPLYETYFGYAIKHRSGVFGLFDGVYGGSNYNTLYLEKNF